MKDELYRLRETLRRVQEAPQSARCEDEIAVLEFEINELEAKRQVRINSLARLLFEAYKKNGCMKAIHPSGLIREGSVGYGGSDIQYVWNIRDEAQRLAEWSTP